jgi:hypothetical protein
LEAEKNPVVNIYASKARSRSVNDDSRRKTTTEEAEKIEKVRRTRGHRGIFTSKAHIEEQQVTRRPRNFHRWIPKGSDSNRTNSIDIPQKFLRNRVMIERPTYTERERTTVARGAGTRRTI